MPPANAWTGQEETALCFVVAKLIEEMIHITKKADFYNAVSESLGHDFRVTRSGSACRRMYSLLSDGAKIDEGKYLKKASRKKGWKEAGRFGKGQTYSTDGSGGNFSPLPESGDESDDDGVAPNIPEAESDEGGVDLEIVEDEEE